MLDKSGFQWSYYKFTCKVEGWVRMANEISRAVDMETAVKLGLKGLWGL